MHRGGDIQDAGRINGCAPVEEMYVHFMTNQLDTVIFDRLVIIL
jgi:hypothetical protein